MQNYYQKFIESVKISSLVDALASSGNIGVMWLLIVGAVGAIVAMFGYKIHKLVVIGTGMSVGALFGHFIFQLLSGYIEMPMPAWVLIVGLALVFGGLTYGIFHSGMALIGAAGGGVLGWLILSSILRQPEKGGYGVAVGIIVGGAASFLFKRLIVTFFSSVIGAYAVVLALAAIIQKGSKGAADFIVGNDVLPMVWVLAFAGVGFWFQYRRLPPLMEDEDRPRRRKAKKRVPQEEEEEADDLEE